MTETITDDAGMEEPLILERLSDLHDQDEYLANYPDIRGRAVVNPVGEEVGTVDDLYVNPRRRKVEMAAITFTGPVGSGGKSVLVPVDEIRHDEDQVKIMTAYARIEHAPEFHPDALNYESCCDFWGDEAADPQDRPGERNPLPPGRLELEDEDEYERSLASEE